MTISKAQLTQRVIAAKDELTRDDENLANSSSRRLRVGEGWDTGFLREAKTLLNLADEYQEMTADKATASQMRLDALTLAKQSGQLDIMYRDRDTFGYDWGNALDPIIATLNRAITHLLDGCPT